MKKFRDIATRMIPVVLVVIMLGFLSLYICFDVLSRERESCWDGLDKAMHDVENEIGIRFTDNLNMLDLAAEAIVLRADLTKHESILAYLSTVQERTMYDRIDIIFPDGKILLQNGEYATDDGKVSYADLLARGPHLSVRRADPVMGGQVIYYFTPVITNGKDDAILIGIVSCDTVRNIFTTAHYGGTAQLFLVDRRDGSYLLDSRHSAIGNINDEEIGELAKGYEDVDFIADILSGTPGRVAFTSKTDSKLSYMSYVPVEGFDFTLAYMVREDEIFKDIAALRRTLTYAGILETALLIGYLIWNILMVTSLVNNREKARLAEIENEKNEAKSRFLSSISHDIRTPLNGIVGMLEVIRLRGDIPEHMTDPLHKIGISAKYLMTLAGDVLDMNELETGKMIIENESLSLTELVSNIEIIMEPKARERGVELAVDSSGITSPNVLGSTVHITKILTNLISNSIKYNKENGKVWLTVENTQKENGMTVCRFTVKDTGIGISEEFQKNMFKAFEQEQAGARTGNMGHGLGLSIVSRLVEKMGGSIDVDSRKDMGTTFVVTLTLPVDTSMALKPAEVETGSVIKGANILLVEDNELNMEIADIMLSGAGAKVTKAENGRYALTVFAQSDPYTFDAILMDIMMPDMDGHEATRRIRSLKRRDAGTVPIIAMTASTFTEDIKRCRESGMNEHIGKPLDMNTVLLKTARQIERFRSERP